MATELRCPDCNRFLGEMQDGDMLGSVSIRIPCPKCRGGVNYTYKRDQLTSGPKVTSVKATS